MWSSNRRRFGLLLAAGFGLAACGFTPAYAPGGSGHALRGQVRLAVPQNRESYEFRNRLEDRLGALAGAPRYQLNWAISTEPVGAGIQPSGAISRYTLRGRVSYTLVSSETGKTESSGVLENFTGWANSGSTVATLSAEADANRRLMIILADQLVARLLASGVK